MNKNMIESILELDRFTQFKLREIQELEDEFRTSKMSARKFKEKSASVISDIEWSLHPSHYESKHFKNKEFSLLFNHIQDDVLDYLKCFEENYKEALSTPLCDEEIALTSEALCYQESWI